MTVVWVVLGVVTAPFIAGWAWLRWDARRQAVAVARARQALERGDVEPAIALLGPLGKDGALADAKLLVTGLAQRDPARLEPVVSALTAWEQAAAFGSGAFHADGWASLTLDEKRRAFVDAAAALQRDSGTVSGSSLS